MLLPYLICSFLFHTVTNLGHLATKMEAFVSKTVDSQPLTILIRNFVLYTKNVLDPRDDFKSEFKWI